jgi:Tat protein translocase TatB subunit
LEIFGIGLPELMMIMVVALIVLGPDRLPEAARSVGKAVSDIRRATEPARAAWTELTNEVNTVVSTATLQSKPSGNPWEIHPILAKMTPEEREVYMAGGEMPAHVAEELEKMTLASVNGRNGTGEELPGLDYPMPHGEPAYQPAPPFAADRGYILP